MGLKKLFDSGYKELKRCKKIADKIMLLDDQMQALTDEQLRDKTTYFKEKISQGSTLDDILVEAFAVAREAAYRVTGMKAYYVQLVGGIAIHGGNISEMKTGEGKTLTAVLPAYLNALSGNGVHIVTVNEYLAGREANGEIGEIYKFLGLTVGLNLRELSREQKKEAYSCDILYSTNSELGFDYLRDNMVPNYEDVTQIKGLNYAIIDETDSILIDDARTPLIISGPTKDDNGLYEKADSFVKSLTLDDYNIDIESRTISLTTSGVNKAEKFFRVENIYDVEHVTLVHRINNALKAVYIFADGKEYVVQDGEVLIVDASTGRILKGRQFSEGLHQAIEAKENVEIKKESITVATITYQNFFRMYNKLSGMTGTAKTEEEEFRDIYNMYVVEIPTNKPVIRQDTSDYLFLTKEYKFKALIEDVKDRHTKGQPILIGTANVETSELVHNLLDRAGLPHEMLNAKNNEREADIIAKAGEIGAITLSTNMAGRGTDIKLAPGVAELGGLAVLGTERFESRRIDNQLRGRSGRQGDPGYSRFFISCEDDLIQRFGGDGFKNRLASIIRAMGDGDESKPLENKMLTRLVTSAQTKIEGLNYDSRKNILKYDDVVRRQREIFYKQRMEVIKAEKLDEILKTLCKSAIENKVEEFMYASDKFDDDKFCQLFNEKLFRPGMVDVNVVRDIEDDEDIIKFMYDICVKDIDTRLAFLKDLLEKAVPKDVIDNDPTVIEKNLMFQIKRVILPVLDRNWREHIDDMQGLRQGIHLQSYAQTDPLQLYQKEGYSRFERLNRRINEEILITAMHTTFGIQRRTNNVETKEEDTLKGLSTNQDTSRSLPKTPIRNNTPQNKGAFANVGPNASCPCGSGLKFKFCHGLKRN